MNEFNLFSLRSVKLDNNKHILTKDQFIKKLKIWKGEYEKRVLNIIEWLEENNIKYEIKNNYYDDHYGTTTQKLSLLFENDSDALMYKLTWVGLKL